jgi:hypothetical protein
MRWPLCRSWSRRCSICSRRPSACRAFSERDLDLGGGLLGGDDGGDPLSGYQVLDEQRAHSRAGEVCCVVDPDRVRGVVGPRRERLAHRGGGPWPGGESTGHAHAARAAPRRARPTLVPGRSRDGPAFGVSGRSRPLVIQRQDRLHLIGEQSV